MLFSHDKEQEQNRQSQTMKAHVKLLLRYSKCYFCLYAISQDISYDQAQNQCLQGRKGKRWNKSSWIYNLICHITLSELSPKPIFMQQKKINILRIHQIFIPKLVFPGLINLFIQLGRIYQHAKIKCNFKRWRFAANDNISKNVP